jgi:hypothetical protein
MFLPGGCKLSLQSKIRRQEGWFGTSDMRKTAEKRDIFLQTAKSYQRLTSEAKGMKDWSLFLRYDDLGYTNNLRSLYIVILVFV